MSYYFKESFESIKKWGIDKFIRHLEALEAIKSEDNLTLQKMLDNHLYANSSKGLKEYLKLYKEFEEKIKREYKVVKIEKSSQQYIDEHEKRMKRLRGG